MKGKRKMSSHLFSFLTDSQLASLGEEIEQYLFSDPQAVLVKARVFSEKLVKKVMELEKLEEVFEVKHVERLHKLLRTEVITEEIYQKLDWIRRSGNKAAHEAEFANIEHALKAHRYLYEIAVWYQELYGEWDFKAPPYRLPQPKTNELIDKEELSDMIRQVIEQTIGQTVDQTVKSIQKEWNQLKAQAEKQKQDHNQSSHALKEEEKLEKPTFPLVQYLQEKGLEVIDKRSSGGALWVVGGWELNEVLFPLKEYKIYFRFTKKGSRSTGRRPAWFLLGKYQEDPVVPALDPLKEKSESTLSDKAESEKKKVEQPLFQVSKFSVDMVDKEQFFIPLYLLEQPLAHFDSEVLLKLSERYNLVSFQDLTIDHLRSFYKEEKEAFFDLLLQLWFLGVVFTENLSKLFHIQYEDTGERLEVKSDEEISLAEIFPIHWVELFRRFGITKLQQLHGLPVYSLQWLLKDSYEEMLRFSIKYSELKMKKPEKITSNKKVIIQYHDETIEIPPEQWDKEITFEDFPGCNALIRGLKGTLNVHTLGEIPSPLDQVHTHLKNVGPAAVKKFWGHLTKQLNASIIKQSDDLQGEAVSFNGEDLIFPSAFKKELIEDDHFTSVDYLLKQLKEHGITRYEQLPYRLEELCQISGVGQLKVEKFFQQLKVLVAEWEKKEKEEEMLKQMTDEEKIQYYFTQFIEKLESAIKHDELETKYRLKHRWLEILQKKFEKFQQGHHMTLAELGEEFGVTRERIRQIVKKAIIKLQALYQPWINQLEKRLDEEWMIENRWIDPTNFIHFIAIEVLEQHNIYYHHEIQMISKETMQEIEKLKKKIQNALFEKYRGQLVLPNELQAIKEQIQESENVPAHWAHHLVEEMFSQTSSGAFILSRSKKMDVVELVLKQFPEGVEIYKQAAELCRLGNEMIPGMFQDEREFTSVTGREEFAEKVYLWGRGTYIHASFVTVSQELVDALVEEIEKMLKDRPFVAVNKIYAIHQDKLKECNIPNEYALYEILRKHARSENIAFPKFPRIARPGITLGKNRDLIISYIREKNRSVTFGELKDEFIGKRGWQRFTLEWSLSNEDSIIQVDFGKYALIEFFDHITSHELAPIQEKIDRSLESYPAIQVRGLFHEFESYCKGLKIHTHYLLYSLLKHRFRDQYQFPRYPHIARLDTDIDNLTVTSIIEDYLLEQGCEVSREELVHYITEEIGAREVTLYVAIQNSEKIFYYTRGQFSEFIHCDVIGWNEEKQKQLHEVILELINSEIAQKQRPYILMDQCFKEEMLPSLENEIPWTIDLLIECVKKDPYFVVIGSLGRIVLKRDNPWKIQTETDFIAYLLQEEFKGAAKKKELFHFLQTIGFSTDGDLLHETKVQLHEGTAPFVQVGDEFILKTIYSGENHD